MLTAVACASVRPRVAVRQCATQARVEISGKARVKVNGRDLRLSPSAISAFKQCPLQWKLRYIDRLPEPTNENLATGIIIHEAPRPRSCARPLPPAPYRGPLHAGAQALAELFKLPRHERDLPTLEALFRSAWGRVRTTERYRPLFFERAARPDGADDDAAADDSWSHDRERERAWGLRALAALSRYFELEDPASIEPVACEERLTCSFDDLPPITGVIDRLDGDGVITDYKSGRAPHLKYARGTNARIRGESFFQLRFYAWLLRERGVPATALRLLYLGDAHEMRAEVSDDDIDRTADEARAT